MATAKELIESITSLAKSHKKGLDTHMAMSLWTPRDVEDLARSLGIPLTQDQVEGILEYLDEEQSSEHGIGWQQIKQAILDVKLCPVQELLVAASKFSKKDKD